MQQGVAALPAREAWEREPARRRGTPADARGGGGTDAALQQVPGPGAISPPSPFERPAPPVAGSNSGTRSRSRETWKTGLSDSSSRPRPGGALSPHSPASADRAESAGANGRNRGSRPAPFPARAPRGHRPGRRRRGASPTAILSRPSLAPLPDETPPPSVRCAREPGRATPQEIEEAGAGRRPGRPPFTGAATGRGPAGTSRTVPGRVPSFTAGPAPADPEFASLPRADDRVPDRALDPDNPGAGIQLGRRMYFPDAELVVE